MGHKEIGEAGVLDGVEVERERAAGRVAVDEQHAAAFVSQQGRNMQNRLVRRAGGANAHEQQRAAAGFLRVLAQTVGQFSNRLTAMRLAQRSADSQFQTHRCADRSRRDRQSGDR